MVALLGGCAPRSPAGDPPGGVIGATAPAQAAETVSEETADRPESAPEPPALALQRAACLRQGGQLTLRAAGIHACVRPTQDAGTRCETSNACEGLCLARSGTCAPLTPLYGCHDVLTGPGRRETICTE